MAAAKMRILPGTVMLAALLGVTTAANGQKIELRVSSTEAFVGEALRVQVMVSNMGDSAEPIPPKTKDFNVQRDPSMQVGSSHRIEISFGRRTEKTEYTYHYLARPQRIGRLVLPPFSVKHKGRIYHTKQIPIRVRKDTSGTYLLCKITTDAASAYVGQAVDLTLEIWVKQYRHQQVGLLDARTMWGFRDAQSTVPGVFDQAQWGSVRYYQDTRTNKQGAEEDYYVYLLNTTVYPTKAGPFDFGGVAVGYRYPKKLGRDRFFFSRWQVTDSRRLRAVAKTPRLEIKSIPTQGRPADFNGAIGIYHITTKAKPIEVPVGDPITLTLTISGDGPLEQLRPPRLDRVEDLTRGFEVSGESLAGEIQGTRKLFSQTIRALRQEVTEIPPIPFSYFDINTGQFETAWSKPISLTVKPAERLALSTLSGLGTGPAVLAPLVESTEGLLANETDPALLLAEESNLFAQSSWLILAAMPVLYLVTWFVQRRTARYRDDTALQRRSRAYRRARKALKPTNAEASPARIRAALVGYIADRCNVPAGGLTRADAVALIAERRIPEETRRAVDDLLASLEMAEYGDTPTQGPEDESAAAKRLVDELERQRLK